MEKVWYEHLHMLASSIYTWSMCATHGEIRRLFRCCSTNEVIMPSRLPSNQLIFPIPNEKQRVKRTTEPWKNFWVYRKKVERIYMWKFQKENHKKNTKYVYIMPRVCVKTRFNSIVMNFTTRKFYKFA